MVMGYDNRFGCDGPRDRGAYDELGREAVMRVVHVAPRLIDGVTASSSHVRELIAEGSVDRAAAMLGRSYSIGGPVVHGRRLGHTLGCPTANVLPPACRLLPSQGGYAALASVDGAAGVPAMVNIGVRPTVDTSAAPSLSVEAHLIDAPDADLYGHRLELGFVQRLRPERRFGSTDELRAQLEADRLRTIEILRARS